MRQTVHPSSTTRALAMVTTLALVALAFAAHAASAAVASGQAVAPGACEPPIRGVVTECGWVESGGYRLRTILTKPEGVTRRLPAVLFIQWLSCDPVALPAAEGDGWARTLRGLVAQSGVVVARAEKAGISGSGGPACSALGYDEELAGHRAALAALRRSPHVDPDSIFVFGASMGGTMAPLVAAGGNVRGVLVWGTTGKTWAEHMIALDRRVLTLRGVAPDSIGRVIGWHALFHALYLVEGRAPPAIIAERPRLAAAWRRMLGADSAGRQQYGRPIRFHQEAERAGWEGAWARIEVPVLVVRGEYDWIMPADEHEWIAEIVNARRAGLAEVVVVPRVDHNFFAYPSPRSAFRGEGGAYDAGALEVFLDWLAKRRRG